MALRGLWCYRAGQLPVYSPEPQAANLRMPVRGRRRERGAGGGARRVCTAEKAEGFYSSEDEESQSSTSLSATASNAGGLRLKARVPCPHCTRFWGREMVQYSE